MTRTPTSGSEAGTVTPQTEETGEVVSPGADGSPVLDVRDVSKRFGPVTALGGVSMQMRAGEVVALIGDNGAGKSTLVSIISGVSKPDTGEVLFGGRRLPNHTPKTAREAGVETVFQNLALVPTLSIADNIYLGRELCRGGSLGRRIRSLDKRRMHREVEAAFGRLGLELPPVTAKAGALSGGQRQAVAVARAVLWQSKVVILDEPAAALGVKQTEAVLSLVEGLREHGVATLFVSHNMQEVMRVADRVVVMRLGRKVADLDVREQSVSPMQLVGLITGGMTAAEL